MISLLVATLSPYLQGLMLGGRSGRLQFVNRPPRLIDSQPLGEWSARCGIAVLEKNTVPKSVPRLPRGVARQCSSGSSAASDPPDRLSSVTNMKPIAGVFVNSTRSMTTGTSVVVLGGTDTNIAFDTAGANALKCPVPGTASPAEPEPSNAFTE